ncbi:MAG: nuclease-related domain-containing protein [Actinomycetota bacterium]|nr:nuclease-related domain-containing protein [Actinomycetota bacterium]
MAAQLTGWSFKPLAFGGRCRQCGGEIPPKAEGWHNPSAPPGRKVVCAACWPRFVESESGAPERLENHVGGTSTLRDAAKKRRGKRTWQLGAAGEYLLSLTLAEELTNDQIVLTDRSVPNSPANIDFLVVASSGVWLIDAKKWTGRISYRSRSLFSPEMRLYVGGADRTDAIDAIYGQVIPVAQIINDLSVPIFPALVFVEGDWDAKLLLRRKPVRHDRVWISPPRMLTKLIKAPGPLSQEQIVAIAHNLREALPER